MAAYHLHIYKSRFTQNKKKDYSYQLQINLTYTHRYYYVYSRILTAVYLSWNYWKDQLQLFLVTFS